jgi:hypothetical protein
MDIVKTPVDIKTLINTSTLDIYDKNRFINKLQEHFSEEEQSLYVCHLFLYLNYHPTADYIVNLENVWKFIGFANKENAKRTIKNNFVEGEDYKKLLVRTDEQLQILLVPKDEQRIKDTRGGHNQEIILLNVDTFKNLCMIAKTENGKKIRRYYVKLENVYNNLMKEEIEETQKQLEEKETQLEEQQKKIEFLENKPETEGFGVKAGYIYIIKDSSSLGAYKVGLGEKPDRRVISMNISSSQKSLKMIEMYKINNMKCAEKIIHILLEPFRIKKRNEWFYLSSDTELNYAMNIIKTSIEVSDMYSFIDYISFKNYADKLPKLSKNKEEKEITIEKPDKYINTNFMKTRDKISAYNGGSWSITHNKWVSRITNNNNTVVLGYFTTEMEAAIAYNDYASYLNQDIEIKYRLNEIEDYIPNSRDVLKEYKDKRLQSKTTKFIGVYYIKSKQMFEASIGYKKKNYKLCKHINDVECAKIYNEQALYFNNHLGTNYKINDIPDFITIEKNHIHDLELNKFKKYSRFIGVSIRNDNGKFRSYIKHNGKRIDCGTHEHEIDAAIAYNKKANELNQLEETKIKYKLNDIENDDITNDNINSLT